MTFSLSTFVQGRFGQLIFAIPLTILPTFQSLQSLVCALIPLLNCFGQSAHKHAINTQYHSLLLDSLFDGLQSGDLLVSSVGGKLLSLIQCGRVVGGFGSPPCSTISAARHRDLKTLGGPRPLRARSSPWICLPNRTKKEQHAVGIGSALCLLTVGLLGEIAAQGGWVGFEHPADRQREPFPSFFPTLEFKNFCQFARLQYFDTYQCMFGAAALKPTGLLLPVGSKSIVRHCSHSYHKPLIGLDNGVFLTTAAAEYPQAFSEAIAQLFVDRLALARAKGYGLPFRPRAVVPGSGVDPWSGSCTLRWQWPEPSPGFLVELLERLKQTEVSHRTGRPRV